MHWKMQQKCKSVKKVLASKLHNRPQADPGADALLPIQHTVLPTDGLKHHRRRQLHPLARPSSSDSTALLTQCCDRQWPITLPLFPTLLHLLRPSSASVYLRPRLTPSEELALRSGGATRAWRPNRWQRLLPKTMRRTLEFHLQQVAPRLEKFTRQRLLFQTTVLSILKIRLGHTGESTLSARAQLPPLVLLMAAVQCRRPSPAV